MNILSMNPSEIIVRVFAVFVCLTFHELAHGYAAYLLGDTTAQRQGRLSVNPMAHIDPIGLLCLFIAGIGWAKPVPVNPAMFRMKNKKVGMAITAAAGPLMNFVMSFVCLAAYLLVQIYASGAFALAVCEFLWEIAILGIGLGVFNLIPIPPLDGSKILMIFLPYDTISWIYRNEGVIRFIFLICVFFNAFTEIIGKGLNFIFTHMFTFIIWLFEIVGIL